MTPQITLRTLLREDPLYRKWFAHVPELTVAGFKPPWRVYVQAQERGRWSRLDFPDYSKAYKWLGQRLPELFDATLHSKRQGFKPPVVKVSGHRRWWPCPDDHTWCVYCRRPTVFSYYNKHPALTIRPNPNERRCRICGARKSGMKEYPTQLVWPLLSNS